MTTTLPGQIVLAEKPASALVQGGQDTFSALERLSMPERQKAGQLAQTINPADTMSITNFGVTQQQRMTGATQPLLDSVRSKDTGEAGQILAQLLNTTQAIDPSALSQGRGMLAKVPIIGKLVDRVSAFIQQYEKAGAQIDRLQHQLELKMRELSSDVRKLDSLFEENKARLQELLIYIAAGEIRLAQLRRTHAEMVQKASLSGDASDAQDALDFQGQISRLERRVYDLKLLVVVSQQMGPQIRLVQAADQGLVEKLQTSLFTMIPLWKQQVVIAIALFNQKQATQLQGAVTKATNDMLLANSQALHTGTVAVANEVERGVIEIETLRQTHTSLIATINEALQIQQQGRQRRIEGERELNGLTKDLAGQLVTAQQNSLRLTGN